MRRLLVICIVLAATAAGVAVPRAATALPPPLVQVGGVGVGTYPSFDPAILRYAVTTTAATAGSVTVTAPPGSLVDGVASPGAVTLTGLTEGDEISVRGGGLT